MIKNISSENSRGETLVVELTNPDASGFFIVDCEGLGAPKAIINTDSSVESRNITLTLGIKGLDNDVEASRQELYKYFPIRKAVTFGVETEYRNVVIEAFIESNEANIFNRVSHNIISLVCPTSYFEEPGETKTLVSGTVGLLEFPVSNESLINPLINLGEIGFTTAVDIQYAGDVETGVVITIDFQGLLVNLSVSNVSLQQTMVFDTSVISSIVGGPIRNGDRMVMDTVIGRKHILFYRDGIEYNIINSYDLTGTWLTIDRGLNTFVFDADIGIDKILVEIKHDVLFEGV